jgi:hypothetical protein
MSDAEKFARAVVLFHQGGEWTRANSELWFALTKTDVATTRTLCDFARKIIDHEGRAA